MAVIKNLETNRERLKRRLASMYLEQRWSTYSITGKWVQPELNDRKRAENTIRKHEKMGYKF